MNQLSISWVGGTIKKWVMLYAGNSGDFYLADPANDRPGEARARSGSASPTTRGAMVAPEAAPPGGLAVRDGIAAWGQAGSCSTRSASTSPAPRARAATTVRPIDFYVGCFPIGKTFDNGFLYAPNIIDSYTESDGDGGMNIYWNVSIWNPYAVLYLKTNLKPPLSGANPGVDMAEPATTLPTLEGDYALTQDQIDSFRDNGFVYLPSVCSPAEVAYFREAIARVTYAHNNETRPLTERDAFRKLALQTMQIRYHDPR